jgi:hypothetical protein
MSRCDSARHADPAYHRGSDDGSEWRRGGWILESLVVSPARSPRALQGLVSDHSQQQYLPTGSVDELVDNPEHYSFFTWNCKALLSLPHFKAGAKRLNHLNYIVSNVKLSTIVYATLDVLRAPVEDFCALQPQTTNRRAPRRTRLSGLLKAARGRHHSQHTFNIYPGDRFLVDTLFAAFLRSLVWK